MEIRLDEALGKCTVLKDALTRIEDAGGQGHPAVFRFEGMPEGKFQLTPRLLQAEAVNRLADVATGKADRESLLQPKESSALHLDPSKVRDALTKNRRGVEILTTWFTEGGPSPAFVETVNGILRQDKGITPALSGLINASATLAHLAAGALGTTAEALIANLVGLYGEYGSATSVPGESAK